MQRAPEYIRGFSFDSLPEGKVQPMFGRLKGLSYFCFHGGK